MFVGVGLRALLVSELYCAISKKKELQSYWISTICLFKWSPIIFDFGQQIRLWESFHAVNKWDYESLFTLPLIYLKKETRIAYFTGRRDSIYVGTILRRSTKGREEFSIYHFLIKKNSAFIYQSSLYKDGKKGRKKTFAIVAKYLRSRVMPIKSLCMVEWFEQGRALLSFTHVRL